MNKRPQNLFLFIFTLFFTLFLISAGKVSAQNTQKFPAPNAIPANVGGIIQHSCTPCHWAGGGFKPTSHVNFSKWDNYGINKQANKAKLICSVLQKGSMPPAEVQEKRPDKIPTKDQIETICKWSETLQAQLAK